MQITPFGDFVIVELDFREKVSTSGLVTMTGADEYPNIGVVKVTGSKVGEELLGQKVFFRRYKFEEVEELKTKEHKYMIGKIEDVLGQVHD